MAGLEKQLIFKAALQKQFNYDIFVKHIFIISLTTQFLKRPLLLN
jgi:hypothetical protein